jgi:hypothetical protein
MTTLIRYARPAVLVVLLSVAISQASSSQTLQTFAARNPTTDSDCATSKVNTAVFLSGALTGAKDSSNATATSGALGISHLSSSSSFSGQINVAAKTDTVRDGFGASLLTPGSGKALSAGLFEWRQSFAGLFTCARRDSLPFLIRQIIAGDRLKARVYGTVSSSVWSLPAAGTEPAGAVSVVPIGFGVGLGYTMISETLNDKPIVAGFVFGFSRRLIHGDIAGESHNLQREAILGTNKESFSGYEAGLELQFAQISGGVTFYSFPRAATVPGFSRGQVVAGFSIRSNVLEKDGTENAQKPPVSSR